MTESQYQTKLIRKIERMFPGVVAIKNDAQYQQGFPDWTLFFGPKWATLEIKASQSSAKQPNQVFFVNKMNGMSFSAIVYPENEREVLLALEQAFAS